MDTNGFEQGRAGLSSARRRRLANEFCEVMRHSDFGTRMDTNRHEWESGCSGSRASFRRTAHDLLLPPTFTRDNMCDL
jgi:hypothetical protein